MPVWCECIKKSSEDESRQGKAILSAMRTNELRKLSLMDSSLSEVHFSKADITGENTRSIEICRRYAHKFQQMKQDNRGLLMFGDSVFEDTGTEFSRRFQMVQAGMLRPELLNSWYFGVPLEKAKDMIPEMTSVFGGD